MKYKLVIPFIILLVLLLSGCNLNKLPDNPQKAIETIQRKMGRANSYHADMTLNIDMDFAEETVKMELDSKMINFTNPYKGKLTMDIKMDYRSSEKTELYITKNEDHYLIYKGINGNWEKENMDKEMFEAEYTTQADINLYIANKESFRVKERINESDKIIVVLEGTVTKEALEMIIDSVDLTMDHSVATGLGDMPILVYIDEATSIPQKITIDLTDIMQEIMDTLFREYVAELPREDAISFQVTDSVMTMNYSLINKAEDFTIPEAVLETK